MRGSLTRFENAAELYHAAARFIVEAMKSAVRESRKGTLLLSGGTTPEAVYSIIASEPFRSALDWNTIHMFWGDERCVPPTHEDSNYRTTYNAMLKHLPIPGENVHRIFGELPPGHAAELYEVEMRDYFSLQYGQHPRFDVTLLGLGEDGHTASLFPKTAALDERTRLVAGIFVPTLNAHRVSVTFPVLNNSDVVLFLVSGAHKAAILREVLEGTPDRYPAQRVQPASEKLHWFVDSGAASLLRTT